MRADIQLFLRQYRGCASGPKPLTASWPCAEAVQFHHGQGIRSQRKQRLCHSLGYEPVIPPYPNRVKPWTYDKALYKKRNEIERLFRRLKGFRRIATRYDTLDVMSLAFIVFALIALALNYC